MTSEPVIAEGSAGAKTQAKRHSPIFLAVFAMFLIVSTICLTGTVLGVLKGEIRYPDTKWFWASGQLLTHRTNPYDQNAVGRMQTSAGAAVHGNDVVRNPPSALFLIAILGFLHPRAAVMVWGLLLAMCLALSVLTMRAILEGTPGYRYDRWYLILMWLFAPALACVESGQTGVVILLGLVLFLRFYERQPFWAGAALSLCAFKPHLFLPFGVVLLVWVAMRRRWPLLAGAIVALVAESAVAMAFDPAVWQHYIAAMRTQGIANLYVPTLGVALRFLVDKQAMWVEFVPAIAACAWGVWYFWRNREQWDWRTHGSLLTLVSLVVAPYSWSTDNVIVLPAILFAMLGAQPPRRGSVTLLLAAMSLTAVEMMFGSVFYFRPNLILSLIWLGWYLYSVCWRWPHGQRLRMTAPVSRGTTA